ncbi:hypothetical protein CF319_g9423 [Tilletia indica]|nr:hypothetical protein CF319_g9423 [Tilletia indica]
MIATAEQEVSAASAREPVIIDGMPAVPAPAGISTGSLDVRMTAESWALIANLQDVGGQDGYDEATETRDCDWDKREQYMALPKDWAYPTVPVADVGSGNVGTSFALRDLAQVHALNKGRCSDWAYAAQFALLRMEIVRAGWVDTSKQTNIILVDPLDDDVALRTLVCDLANLRHKIHQVRTLGYLLPLIAEHGFRTRGIHWRHTNEPGLYTLSYQSCARLDWAFQADAGPPGSTSAPKAPESAQGEGI